MNKRLFPVIVLGCVLLVFVLMYKHKSLPSGSSSVPYTQPQPRVSQPVSAKPTDLEELLHKSPSSQTNRPAETPLRQTIPASRIERPAYQEFSTPHTNQTTDWLARAPRANNPSQGGGYTGATSVSAPVPQSTPVYSKPYSSDRKYIPAALNTMPENLPGTPTNRASAQPVADPLGEYTAKLSYAQQKELNTKIQNMSLGVEQAILRAMAPKSKQDEMMEKYLARRGTNGEEGSAASAGSSSSPATQQVMRQLAAQTRNVVASITQAYGKEAGTRVERMMKDFAKEMQAIMDGPGTPEEKQRKANALNKKYNDKLQKFNQEEGNKQMQAQLAAESEAKLAKIRGQFNEGTEAAVRARLEGYEQKRMEILQTPQSAENMHKQMLDLQRQEQKDIENIVLQQNPDDLAALAKLRQLENDAVREQIAKEKAAVESGEKEAQAFRMDEKSIAAFRSYWQEKDTEYQQGFEMYGTQVQGQARQILQDLRQKQEALVSAGGNLHEINEQNEQLEQAADAQLKALREENRETYIANMSARLNTNNTQRLQDYTNQLTEVSEPIKEAWKSRALPILEQYNAQRAALLAGGTDNADINAAMQQLGQQEHQALMRALQQTAAAMGGQ